MNDETRFKITDNEFADLIIANDDVVNVPIEDKTSVNIINSQYSTVYIPVSNMTYNSIYKFSYASIPKCFGLMSSTNMEESGVLQLRSMEVEELKGDGVLIGIIDTGIDYTNPLFINSDRTSRIASLWDQTIFSNDQYPKDMYYGTEYSNEKINQALLNDSPLLVVPSTDELGHGTMLAGIAGGYDSTNSAFVGIAPNAEFVIVKLKPAKPYLKEFLCIPESALCFQENDIMMGITYLQQIAGKLNRPMVICLGVGSSQGSHVGQCILCEYLYRTNLIRGRAVVVAAGNEGNRGHHYSKEVSSNVESRLNQIVDLNVGVNESGFSMELWGDAPNIFGIEIITPSGEHILNMAPTLVQQDTILLEYEETTLYIDTEVRESRVGDQFILIRFKNPISGIWRFEVYSVEDLPMRFNMWLPINNFITEGTYFINPVDYTTIAMLGNTDEVITVSAYNPIDTTLYQYASKGFTKSNLPKPEVTAPGVNIYAPTIGGLYINTSGTGIAAAHAAGIAVLLLEWGIVRGNQAKMNGMDINRAFIRGAKRDPNLQYPNPEWGYGILNLDNVLVSLYISKPRNNGEINIGESYQ